MHLGRIRGDVSVSMRQSALTWTSLIREAETKFFGGATQEHSLFTALVLSRIKYTLELHAASPSPPIIFVSLSPFSLN